MCMYVYFSDDKTVINITVLKYALGETVIGYKLIMSGRKQGLLEYNSA